MGAFDSILSQNTQAAALAVRIGSQTYADPKVISGMIGTVYAPELNPADSMFVIGQGATNTQVLLAAWGACGTATGETFTVGQSYAGSQTTDSLGLQIPGNPAPKDPVQVKRDSRTGSRVITRKPVTPQKRQWYTQEVTSGQGIILKQYGTYAYVDQFGVTHQPPGKRDPVVNSPQINANIDMDTIKFDSQGRMYADFFGTGSATGTGSVGQSINGLNAGHGLEIIPGFSPLDGPSISIEAGGSVPAGNYAWAFCYIIDGKRTPLSPQVTGTTIDGTPNYHQPHLSIPGKPDIIHATALELYRKDASVGANGTINTKFAYSGTPGVLISDPSTGAIKVDSGAYTGMYQYTATSTHTGVDKGDEWIYSPTVRVKVGDPPIPYDPRDGSLTTLIENGAADGSSVFKTSDGGAFNTTTGAVTYPVDNPLNHSGFQLVDTLTPSDSPQDYIDTKTDAALGIAFKRDPTVINIKPARYILAPFSSMSPVPGTVPPLYELSGLKFSSNDPAVSNDGVYVNTKYGTIIDKENNVDVLLAASGVLPATGTGDQTARALAGYDTNVYNESALEVTGGDSGTGLRVKRDGTSIKLNAAGELMAVSSGGGGGGTGSPVALCVTDLETINLSGVFFDYLHSGNIAIDHGGFVSAGSDIGATGHTIVFPAAGTYGVAVVMTADVQRGIFGEYQIQLYQNGTQVHTQAYPYDVQAQDAVADASVFLVDAAAGDTLAIRILCSDSGGNSFAVDQGTINLWLIQGASSSWGANFEASSVPALAAGSTTNLWGTGTWFTNIDPTGVVGAGHDRISLDRGFYLVNFRANTSVAAANLRFQLTRISDGVVQFDGTIFDFDPVSGDGQISIYDYTATHPATDFGVRVTNNGTAPVSDLNFQVSVAFIAPIV